MTIIKDKKIIDDNWLYLQEGQTPQASHNIVDLDYWQSNKSDLIASQSPVGLWVNGDEALENFSADLERFALIAIHFPTFADGRGYSLAKSLRNQANYTKEIRAVGDILPDQALYLSRVGFDALALENSTSARLALEKLAEYSVFYQSNNA